MLKVFSVIKDKIIPNLEKPWIDNWVFKLHYRVTVAIFFIATILVTLREYFGNPIQCINDTKIKGFTKVVETFCFFTTTFSVVEDFDAGRVRLGHVPHPGLGNVYAHGKEKSIRRHTYYQWVPFLLFIQTIMFYLTHILWKNMEAGRISKFIGGLKNSAYAFLDKQIKVKHQKIPSKAQRTQWINSIKHNFLDHISVNRSWALGLMTCEVLNLLHVVFQIYITHLFLGRQFMDLGPKLLHDGYKILDQVFPKVTKCTFYKYGQGGSVQHHDALCIMALNIINEKIYAFLWFWLAILFTISCLIIIWRLVSMVLFSNSLLFNQIIFGRNSHGRLNARQMNMVVRHCRYSDWLLLKYLSKNMNSLNFSELFLSISEDLEERRPVILATGQANKAY